MRDKLNNDPKAQVIAVVLLVVVAAFFFVTKMGGGSEEEELAATEATVSVAGTEATGTAVGATPGEAVEGAVEEAVENTAAEAGAASVIPSSLEAPALPAAVDAAYEADETVVLLIVRDAAITDKRVKKASSVLEGMANVALFVVPVSQISRYAALTLGVEVSRVPALVVMTPRKLSGGTQQATVTYGYQTRQTLIQAVLDANYKGPVETYQPN